MMKLRQAHVDALSQVSRESFTQRADSYLCDAFPNPFGTRKPELRRQFIHQSIVLAAEYGLTSEQAVICFAHIRLLLGDDFAAQPRWDWVPRMLRDEEYEQSFRAKLALHCAADLKAAESGQTG